MELLDKVAILSAAAKYDASCASSGVERVGSKGIGSTAASGICHSWSDDGRCISLLKVLFTNRCIYDCAYCVNRASNDIPRASFTPEELANLTIRFYERNYIEGLFLSSSVVRNPSYTMELLVSTIRLLRTKYRFGGYIHVKAIPGADYALIHEAGTYADRMSVNIELPSSEGLKILAPQKTKEAILQPMYRIGRDIVECREERSRYAKAPSFVPAGHSTQLIVGATPDPDRTILHLSEHLYRKFNLRRVYYSAYVPVSSHPRLPGLKSPPLIREHRLYQADWLLRFYGFSSAELFGTDENLDPDMDPKVSWALRNRDRFPVEVNKADYEILLRVPGLGLKSAKRIIQARRSGPLHFEDLKKLGVVLKRAQYFITCRGEYSAKVGIDHGNLRLYVMDRPAVPQWDQLSLFPSTPTLLSTADRASKLTGEL